MKVIGRAAIAIVLIGVALGGWYYLTSHPETMSLIKARLNLSAAQTPSQLLEASGTIEAETASVTAETGGRIAEILADEGDEVIAGQPIVQISASLLDADIRKAEAGLAVAQAGLDLARAGVPPQAIAVAEALAHQAQVASEGARQAWDDAVAVRAAPQELDVQLASARNLAALAGGQARIADLLTHIADLQQGMYERAYESLQGGVQIEVPGPGGPRIITVPAGPQNMAAANSQRNLAGQRTWQSYAALNEALAARDAAWQTVADLQQERSQPLTLDAQVHTAEAAYHETEQAVRLAQTAIDDLKAGARPEDIAIAQAAVKEAEAALQALHVQRAKMTLSAPLTGLVTERSAFAGETIAPGASVMKIADLDRLTLTIYIPVTQLGRVKLGMPVRVRVDSFPDRSFAGLVSHISAEAEFTPKNVQTKEQRAHMVFAVKVALSNHALSEAEGTGHPLKPGMPADATVMPEGGQ